MFNFAEDINTVFRKDPAARGMLEVLTCYPGLHAVWLHRPAHRLWTAGWCTTARLISHIARFFTGVEIHPGATIGRRFFIDHGMGVVIGETTEIGDDVLLYQGVVLGGTSLEHKKRHPTLGDGVVVGAGSIILGAINIGARSRVGAGSVVLQAVPPDSTVFGVPAHAKASPAERGTQLDHDKVSDVCWDELEALRAEVDALKKKVG
ncbi:MAG: serine O-acetyltransferase [Elusimicrobia bacterium]|nr:MAG: serine O-acetyltransferase [Elusimicrobiota bacterium]KAF0154841.1 MAG: serine O-acetyltransferase [Elusimicrobiota bacterium]